MGRTINWSGEEHYKSPGVCKGVQVVLVSDIDHIRPRAYFHCHNL